MQQIENNTVYLSVKTLTFAKHYGENNILLSIQITDNALRNLITYLSAFFFNNASSFLASCNSICFSSSFASAFISSSNFSSAEAF